MKTTNLLLLLLMSALSIQCSKESVYTGADPVSEPPTLETKAYFDQDGFSSVSNARLIINDLEVTVDPEFKDVAGYLEGRSTGNDWWDATKISEVYLHENGSVFISTGDSCFRFSLMRVDDCWGIQYINQWNLTYSITREAGQPEEITISGTGRGSHLIGLYWENSDAIDASEILFEFRGIEIEDTNDFEGSFTLDEKSPDEKYNLLVTGSLTLERD